MKKEIIQVDGKYVSEVNGKKILGVIVIPGKLVNIRTQPKGKTFRFEQRIIRT